MLALSVVAFVAYAVQHAVRALTRRRSDEEGRLARRLGLLVAIANLMFVAGLLVFFWGLGASVPLPVHQVAWLSVPLLSLGPTFALPIFAWSAWRKGWWSRGQRVGYTLHSAVCLAFATFLSQWNLLGFHY